MDASAYSMAFDKEQLSVLCANYDRRIDTLAKENSKLKAENDKLRKWFANAMYVSKPGVEVDG